jgi:hypothetical protein
MFYVFCVLHLLLLEFHVKDMSLGRLECNLKLVRFINFTFIVSLEPKFFLDNAHNKTFDVEVRK